MSGIVLAFDPQAQMTGGEIIGMFTVAGTIFVIFTVIVIWAVWSVRKNPSLNRWVQRSLKGQLKFYSRLFMSGYHDGKNR